MNMQGTAFTKQELEVIFLKAIIDSLDSMLNSELLELRGISPDCEVYFHQKTHQKYFYILLLDFIHSKTDGSFFGEKVTCLELIQKIQDNATFNINNSVSELKEALNIFNSWLNEEVIVNVYLPTINKECDLKLKRNEFIYVCSNISKHNFTSLTGVSKKVIEILKRSKINIPLHDSLIILEDFYERFHDDLLIYHASNIIEMLNNLRWGLQQYLLPQFIKSYKKDKSDSRGFRYKYSYPTGVRKRFAKICYVGLMNSVRRQPCFKKFRTTKWLKLRY
jgi:hypothetical protein